MGGPVASVICGVTALPVRDVGLRDADDRTIFETAAKAAAVVVTKDSDCASL